MTNKAIGISGVARSGKNTFAECIKQCLPKYKFKEVSLAHLLKCEVKDFIWDKYKISSFTEDVEQKAVFRQEIVDYAKGKRDATQGRYFIEKLWPEIQQIQKLNIIPIVTDIRFNEYDKDEVFWLKDELKGILVHVRKFLFIDNEFKVLGPANETERENDPKVSAAADAKVSWPEGLGVDTLKRGSYDYIKPAIDKIREYLKS